MAPSKKLKVPLLRALVVLNRRRMGVTSQSIRGELTGVISHDVGDLEILAGHFMENIEEQEELIIVFPAEPVNRLPGFFTLSLKVRNMDPEKVEFFRVKKIELTREDTNFVVVAQVKSNATIEESWGYTRHPELRQVNQPLYDDPSVTMETHTFHQSWLPGAFKLQRFDHIPEEWQTARFTVNEEIIRQSNLIDDTEFFLEKLDNLVSADKSKFLYWTYEQITEDTLESAASDVEGQLEKRGKPTRFEVTVNVAGKEITRGKRLRPMVRHPVTIVTESGATRGGTIGISVFYY